VVLEKEPLIISEPAFWINEQNYNWATSLSAIPSRTLATVPEVNARQCVSVAEAEAEDSPSATIDTRGRVGDDSAEAV